MSRKNLTFLGFDIKYVQDQRRPIIIKTTNIEAIPIAYMTQFLRRDYKDLAFWSGKYRIRKINVTLMAIILPEVILPDTHCHPPVYCR